MRCGRSGPNRTPQTSKRMRILANRQCGACALGVLTNSRRASERARCLVALWMNAHTFPRSFCDEHGYYIDWQVWMTCFVVDDDFALTLPLFVRVLDSWWLSRVTRMALNGELPVAVFWTTAIFMSFTRFVALAECIPVPRMHADGVCCSFVAQMQVLRSARSIAASPPGEG